jgi:hypothetical protein
LKSTFEGAVIDDEGGDNWIRDVEERSWSWEDKAKGGYWVERGGFNGASLWREWRLWWMI